MNFVLDKKTTGLLVVDVQEKLFPRMENSCHVFNNLTKAIRGFQILNIPIVVSEQYPEGLGETIKPLKDMLGENQLYLAKTTFSCTEDESLYKALCATEVKQWVVAGLEAHICVFQTARDLLKAGLQVVVLNDAISSRSIYDYSTAIAELRDWGARISSTETVLFELLRDSKATGFKQVSQLIKEASSSSCCNSCPC